MQRNNQNPVLIDQDGRVKIDQPNLKFDTGNQDGNGNFIRLTEDANNQRLHHKMNFSSANPDAIFKFNVASEHHVYHGVTFHSGTIVEATANGVQVIAATNQGLVGQIIESNGEY